MKYCHLCRYEKPDSMFSKNPRSADGLNSGCKSCRRYQAEQRKTRGDEIAYLLNNWKRAQ